MLTLAISVLFTQALETAASKAQGLESEVIALRARIAFLVAQISQLANVRVHVP